MTDTDDSERCGIRNAYSRVGERRVTRYKHAMRNKHQK